MGDDGYPSYYDPTAHPLMCHSNVDARSVMTAQVAELTQGRGANEPSLAVSNASADSPASQLHLRREIVSRLPEHLRCVLPPEQHGKTTLFLAQLEDAGKLIPRCKTSTYALKL